MAKLKINADIHKEIKKLAEDNKIKNLLKLPLDNKNQSALLARASTLVDGDVSNASRRLFQMAQAMSTKTDKYNLTLNYYPGYQLPIYSLSLSLLDRDNGID